MCTSKNTLSRELPQPDLRKKPAYGHLRIAKNKRRVIRDVRAAVAFDDYLEIRRRKQSLAETYSAELPQPSERKDAVL